jgi:hypothetical protein
MNNDQQRGDRPPNEFNRSGRRQNNRHNERQGSSEAPSSRSYNEAGRGDRSYNDNGADHPRKDGDGDRDPYAGRRDRQYNNDRSRGQRGGARGGRGRGRGGFGGGSGCYICGDPGHLARNCPQNDRRGQDDRGRGKQNFVAGILVTSRLHAQSLLNWVYQMNLESQQLQLAGIHRLVQLKREDAVCFEASQNPGKSILFNSS